jgi:hypothetical protein
MRVLSSTRGVDDNTGDLGYRLQGWHTLAETNDAFLFSATGWKRKHSYNRPSCEPITFTPELSSV